MRELSRVAFGARETRSVVCAVALADKALDELAYLLLALKKAPRNRRPLID